jgi:zinc transporter ZupT
LFFFGGNSSRPSHFIYILERVNHGPVQGAPHTDQVKVGFAKGMVSINCLQEIQTLDLMEMPQVESLHHLSQSLKEIMYLIVIAKM